VAINTKLSVSGLAGYKKDLAAAKQSVKDLDDELALAEAEYKKTGDASDYYKRKSFLLQQQIQAQKSAVEKAEAALNAAKTAYGENSKQAHDMASALTRAKTQLVRMETSLNDTKKAMNGVGEAGNTAAGNAETLGEKLGEISGKIDLETLKNGLSGIADTIAGAARSAANFAQEIWNATADAGAWADNLLTQSTQTGIDTTTLQQWQYAAQFVDTEASTIINARKRILAAMGGKDGMSVGGIEIATKDAEGQLRSWDDVFWDSIDALQGMTNETERDQAAMDLFGKSYADMIPLIKAGREEWEKYASSAQVLSEDQVKALGELDDAMNVMNSSLEGSQMQILASLAPVMQTVADAISQVAASLGEYLKTEKGQQLLANLGDTLSGIAQDIFSPEALQNAFDALKLGMDAINNTFVWISENKDKVVSAIQAIAVAFGGIKLAEGVLTFVQLLSSGGGTLGRFLKVGGGAAGAAGSGAGAAGAAGSGGAAAAGGAAAGTALGAAGVAGIAAGYTRVATALANVVDKALDAGSRQAQTDAANAAASKVAGTAYTSENQQRAAEAFANIAATWGMTGAGAHGTGLLGLKLSDRAADSFDYSAGLDELMAYAEEFNLDLSQIFDTTLIERLTAWKRLGELNSQLEETGDLGDLWDEYDALTQRGDIQNESLGHMFGEVFDQMARYLDTVDTLPDQAHSDGVNTSLGLAEGINEGSGAAIEAAQNLADAVKNTISGSLDIQSPSRVMAQLGAYTSEGFALGIEDSLAQVREASGRMAAAALSGPVERAHTGGGAAAAGLDRTALGDALRAALNGVRVDMNGQAVGQIVADTVDEEIGRSAYNARYNV